MFLTRQLFATLGKKGSIAKNAISRYFYLKKLASLLTKLKGEINLNQFFFIKLYDEVDEGFFMRSNANLLPKNLVYAK